MEGVITATI